jgi:hypothetical protein
MNRKLRMNTMASKPQQQPQPTTDPYPQLPSPSLSMYEISLLFFRENESNGMSVRRVVSSAAFSPATAVGRSVEAIISLVETIYRASRRADRLAAMPGRLDAKL